MNIEISLEQKKEQNKQKRLEINKVEGYYPEAELEEFDILDDSGKKIGKRSHLPLNKKKEWFYLCYPEGLIDTKIISIDVSSGSVIAECNLYRNYKDDKNYFISKGVATYSISSTSFSGLKSPDEILGITKNRAMAKATASALFNGGFGLQVESALDEDAAVDTQMKDDQSKYELLPKPSVPKDIPAICNNKIEERGCEVNLSQVTQEKMAEMQLHPNEEFISAENLINKEEKKVEPKQSIDKESMTLNEAKEVKVTSNPTVKTMDDAFSNNSRMILWLYSNGTQEEKMAAKKIIDSDEVLSEQFERSLCEK